MGNDIKLKRIEPHFAVPYDWGGVSLVFAVEYMTRDEIKKLFEPSEQDQPTTKP